MVLAFKARPLNIKNVIYNEILIEKSSNVRFKMK